MYRWVRRKFYLLKTYKNTDKSNAIFLFIQKCIKLDWTKTQTAILRSDYLIISTFLDISFPLSSTTVM